MMRRLILAAVAATLLLPAAAHASVTRATQAVSLPQEKFWSPNELSAQVGDTIEFRMTEPGNANATKHDVWLIKPGQSGNGTRLGSTDENGGIARTVVDQTGMYTFYDSMHGGLAAGGMYGTIAVGTTDPGPANDPGQPWTLPGGGYPGNAWMNPTQAPTIFETGDTTPPTLTLVSSSVNDQTVKLVVYTNEPGTLTSTVTHKKHGAVIVDSSKTVDSVAGQNTLKVKIPVAAGDYVINVVATDANELDSDSLRVPVVVRASGPVKALAASYRPAKRHR